MFVLLIKERAFGVRKTGSVFCFSSSRRKYIYFVCLLNSNQMQDGVKFSGTDKLLFLEMVMASYLFLMYNGFQVEWPHN